MITKNNWRRNWKQKAKQLLNARRVADLPSTFKVWEGPSALTGDPIVVIASCAGADPSANGKTGDMVQIYILPKSTSPGHAWINGAINAVCPDACEHRRDQKGDCYVNWSRLRSAWDRGLVAPDLPDGYLTDAIVRLGAGGDPSAVPFHVWIKLLDGVKGCSGYTAEWRSLPIHWQRLFMASVATPDQAWEAAAMGWRLYAASLSEADDRAYEEQGVKACLSHAVDLPCVSCRQCDGTDNGANRPSFYIPLHGAIGAKRRREVGNG